MRPFALADDDEIGRAALICRAAVRNTEFCRLIRNRKIDMSQIFQKSGSILRPARPRRGRREDLQDIDEALWAAYRRYDRSTVMEKLLQRFLGTDRNRRRRPCHA